jgi:hypothetical protein
LLGHQEIVFEAGSHRESIRMRTEGLRLAGSAAHRQRGAGARCRRAQVQERLVKSRRIQDAARLCRVSLFRRWRHGRPTADQLRF